MKLGLFTFDSQFRGWCELGIVVCLIFSYCLSLDLVGLQADEFAVFGDDSVLAEAPFALKGLGDRTLHAAEDSLVIGDVFLHSCDLSSRHSYWPSLCTMRPSFVCSKISKGVELLLR